jgi:hypothetical protein
MLPLHKLLHTKNKAQSQSIKQKVPILKPRNKIKRLKKHITCKGSASMSARRATTGGEPEPI